MALSPDLFDIDYRQTLFVLAPASLPGEHVEHGLRLASLKEGFRDWLFCILRATQRLSRTDYPFEKAICGALRVPLADLPMRHRLFSQPTHDSPPYLNAALQ